MLLKDSIPIANFVNTGLLIDRSYVRKAKIVINEIIIFKRDEYSI